MKAGVEFVVAGGATLAAILLVTLAAIVRPALFGPIPERITRKVEAESAEDAAVLRAREVLGD